MLAVGSERGCHETFACWNQPIVIFMRTGNGQAWLICARLESMGQPIINLEWYSGERAMAKFDIYCSMWNLIFESLGQPIINLGWNSGEQAMAKFDIYVKCNVCIHGSTHNKPRVILSWTGNGQVWHICEI